MRNVFVFAAFCAAATGCATNPGSTDNDPFEDLNRQIFGFNEAADRAIVGPLADGYRAVTPEPFRDGVSNALQNLNSPVVFANDVLQGKPKRAGETLARFAINTVFGLGGLFDTADQMGIEGHTEDFGQTLAVWGIPEGPYLMVPFMGPSTARDGVGRLVDNFVFDPLQWIEFAGRPNLNDHLRISRAAVTAVNTRAGLNDVFETLRAQPEPYVALRRAYRANREAEINDGKLPDDPYEDLPDFEEFDEFDEFEDEAVTPAEEQSETDKEDPQERSK
ncbi:MAG: VacJ family lipoprotein [Pseudomonadota bacterium]